MSQPKIQELLENCDITISQSTISRILINDETGFNQEKLDIFLSALGHTPYHQIDDTTVRVNGTNHYSQIFCNPYYTAFFTVPRKDRLSILDLLLCGRERKYRFDQNAFGLMADFKVSKKVTDQLRDLTEDKFDELFSTQTIYDALNDRIEKTKNKKDELLLALKYPFLPLHNNDSELGARVEKRRQDVSLHTISEAGTTAKDAFLTIVQTAKKLGVNAFEYISDRVSKKFNMTALSDLIVETAKQRPG